MADCLADTNVIIDFLRGKASAVAHIRNHQNGIALSAVTVGELYAGVRDEAEMAIIDEFLSLFPVLPVDSHTAKLGGVFKRDYGQSHGTGLADGLIAAAAVVHHLELHTLNTKHFPMFDDLRPPY